jgi:hypothetical protein
MVARRESGRLHYAITSSRQLGEQRLRLFSRPGGRGWLMAQPAGVSKIADAMLAAA